MMSWCEIGCAKRLADNVERGLSNSIRLGKAIDRLPAARKSDFPWGAVVGAVAFVAIIAVAARDYERCAEACEHEIWDAA